MPNHNCNCKERATEQFATEEKPYHFVDSGLPNVYLVGIKYGVCESCRLQWASIPAPGQLLNVIAESIVMKPALLSGLEIKFLRKRAGKKAAEFAELINNNPQHFSRLETESLPLNEATDKLIRLTYGMLTKNKDLLARIAVDVEEWLNSIHGNKPQVITLESQDNNWVQLEEAA